MPQISRRSPPPPGTRSAAKRTGLRCERASWSVSQKNPGAQGPSLRSEFRGFCATSDQVVGPSMNQEFGGSCRDRPRLIGSRHGPFHLVRKALGFEPKRTPAPPSRDGANPTLGGDTASVAEKLAPTRSIALAMCRPKFTSEYLAPETSSSPSLVKF